MTFPNYVYGALRYLKLMYGLNYGDLDITLQSLEEAWHHDITSINYIDILAQKYDLTKLH